MRVLVQFPFPGYLRIYGSTVRLLADRGHEVLLSYDRSEKGRDPSAAVVEAHERIELGPPLPAAQRRFERRVGDLRAAADYLRYLDPRFADAPYLRQRLEQNLSGSLTRLTRAAQRASARAGPSFRAALAAERLVPSDRGVERAIAAHSPDLVFVSPLLGRSDRNRRQTDTVKAARRLGIPVGAGIASLGPSDDQGRRQGDARPAVRLERDPARRGGRAASRAAGAGRRHRRAALRRWFDREPTRSPEELLGSFGLDPSARWCCTSARRRTSRRGTSRSPFVRRWLEAVRATRRLGRVLVRPHPYSVDAWAGVDSPDPARRSSRASRRRCR